MSCFSFPIISCLFLLNRYKSIYIFFVQIVTTIHQQICWYFNTYLFPLLAYVFSFNSICIHYILHTTFLDCFFPIWYFSSLVLPLLKKIIKGVESALTTNSLTRIGNGEIICSPIIQIMDFKLTLEDSYSVVLSNGDSTLRSLFSSTVGHYFIASQIAKGSLVELQDFTCIFI